LPVGCSGAWGISKTLRSTALENADIQMTAANCVLGPSPRVLRPEKHLHQALAHPALHSWSSPVHHASTAAPLSGTLSLAAWSSFSGFTTVAQSLSWELAGNVTGPQSLTERAGFSPTRSRRVWMEAVHFPYTGSMGEKEDSVLSPVPTLRKCFLH
jgi:hypothetical protein